MGNSVTKKAKLLAAAKRRTKDLTIDGEVYTIREVSALAFADYGEGLKTGNREQAIATLIADCVLDEDGAQMMTIDEAIQLMGAQRVSVTLVNAIMEISGLGGGKKEAIAS